MIGLLLAVACVSLAACDQFWSVDVYNDSDRCMACFDSKTGKAYDVVFIDSHAVACAEYWGFVVDKKGSYLYVFTPKDTVDKYGREDIISSKRYDCRYVVRGKVLDKLNCRLSYPPTQEMINAGVLVIYPDGHSRKNDMNDAGSALEIDKIY